MPDRPEYLHFDITERFPVPLPASGAWRIGDPVGERKFAKVCCDRPFVLEAGGVLPEVTVAYETWGMLSDARDNAVLVCHALTGDSHAAGTMGPGHKSDGWWNDLIGPGKALDTDRYFIVCANVLGGCQGTTGPASTDPETGLPYGPTFPQVTIRDIVRTQHMLMEDLGIPAWLSVVGGSMGGMQVLEWGVMYPDRLRSLVPIASTAAASPQQIAWSAVERLAIVGDPKWSGGWYYDAADGDGPWQGLALAREISQVTYRTTEVFDERFGREPFNAREELSAWGRYQVESYLDHHGQKLVRRFDANSFLVLSKAMDLHDVGRGRGDIDTVLGRIRVPVLTASVTSDVLYPPYQQAHIHEAIEAGGGDCEYHIVDSPQGHDGFLLESAFLGPLIAEMLTRAEKG
ncbi:MAG: homoserine O-acetyltransferase [Actinomycetota bacterium]